MAVFTPVSADHLQHFLDGYALGDLVSHRGIAQGAVNTNYFVSTTRAELVLTLLESQDAAELSFVLELTAFLSSRGVPCPRPRADRAGCYLGRLCGRPAVLVERLSGEAIERPSANHCAAVGEALAQLHLAASDFPKRRPNPFGPAWQRRIVDTLAARLNDDERTLLLSELEFQKTAARATLPVGIVHTDLFRDNVLFEGERLTGVIDFYFACSDVLLLDVAVCVNDWCVNGEGVIDPERAQALLAGYREQRQVTSAERAAWPALLRAAALRYWLSRLYDRHFPRPAEHAPPRDPDEFRRILLRRRREADATPARWPTQRTIRT